MVWADEFDQPGAPDPSKWMFETGFLRNHEEQIYTDRPENARVENSMLIIEARKENFPNPAYRPGSADWRQQTEIARYTSANLTTATLASWTYGRLEARAKVPRGGGIWPAIWTLGHTLFLKPPDYIDWPRCGEIDIMEFVGSEPAVTHGTLHFDRKGDHASLGAKHHPKKLPGDEFCIYAVEWDPNRIDFFVDGEKFHSVELAPLDEPGGYNGFRHPHFMIVNLALGGGWAGPVDDSVLPQQLLIDYVRVYQRLGRPE